MRLEELRYGAVERLGTAALALLGRTLRFRLVGWEHLGGFREEGRPVIFAFWHAQILPLAYFHRRQGIVVLVSRHRDGEYIARVVQRLGFETARGSSTRGGARGLRELLRAARRGRDLAFTPDGPRGPARRFKPGALLAARLTGAPIIPVAAGVARAWRVSSWDRLMIPKPFSPVRIGYGPPRFIPREADEASLDRYAGELEAELNRLEAEVEASARNRVETES